MATCSSSDGCEVTSDKKKVGNHKRVNLEVLDIIVLGKLQLLLRLLLLLLLHSYKTIKQVSMFYVLILF